MNEGGADAIERLRKERDFYRRLLELGRAGDAGAFLSDALNLVLELSGAQHAYLELYSDEDLPGQPRFSMARGFSEEEVSRIRQVISSGIIAQTLAARETIATSSAMLDPRFNERSSVAASRIEAVLCIPVGDDPPRGILYLQGRSSSRLFDDEQRQRAELFCEHLASLADRLLSSSGRQPADSTRDVRRRLRADSLIGRSAALAALLKQVSLVAPLEVSVLLTGPSGTGKSHIARVIHENSPRAGGPLVELNCAALPESLLESELFGAAAGAHSTATRALPGKVAAAEGGTLLLDEVGEMPLVAQAKLLQLLHDRTYYPLGSAQPRQADVRILAATNADLRQGAAAGKFREDLLYRLEVVPLGVPSLSERREDIAELAAAFCAAACRRHGFEPLPLSPAALRAAETAEWPGNVRQLANAVEAAVIRAHGDAAAAILPAHLFPNTTGGSVPLDPEQLSFQEATRQFQRELVERALRQTDWNVMETARRLGLTRSHLYNLIRAFGLVREPGSGRGQ